MVSLIARSPLAGRPPLLIGDCRLAEIALGSVTSLAPFAGKEAALSKALKSGHGAGFPEPNRWLAGPSARLVWSGRAQAFLIGAAPEPGLAKCAALTDQTDAWAGLRLSGAAADSVLARLIPLDLRLAAFAVGHAARSQLQHVMVLILRTDAAEFELLVMRSFAQTAWHELEEAMKSVAARG